MHTQKGNSKLVFDIKIKSPEGMFLATTAASEARVKAMTIQHTHEVLGHMKKPSHLKRQKHWDGASLKEV